MSTIVTDPAQIADAIDEQTRKIEEDYTNGTLGLDITYWKEAAILLARSSRSGAQMLRQLRDERARHIDELNDVRRAASERHDELSEQVKSITEEMRRQIGYAQVAHAAELDIRRRSQILLELLAEAEPHLGGDLARRVQGEIVLPA